MHKKFLALVSALVLLCGCGNNAEKPIISESSAVSTASTPTSSAAAPQSTASAPKSTASSPKSTASSAVSSVSKVESSPVKTNAIPSEISDYVNKLSNGDRVFVDYKVNENPAAITDKNALGEVYEKALTTICGTDEYKKFFESFSFDDPMGFFHKKPEDFMESGVPTPVFKSALTDDFDCDGKNESFVLISIPKEMSDNETRWGERDFLIYVGDSAEVICDYYGAKFNALLDYGCCKQLIVRSEGWNGNDCLSNIWGVRGGKVQKLYGGRLNYEKADCFLYSTGPQIIGDFAVYDTQNGEYLAIQGKELSAEQIKTMDTDGVFQKDIVSAVLIGGKYYIINRNGVYTYENGRFVNSDEKVRSSRTPGLTGEALNTLADVDYDAALASMITPEEARKMI